MQSVSTFEGCLTVLERCQPVWAVFENVETIDREVEGDMPPGNQFKLETLYRVRLKMK